MYFCYATHQNNRPKDSYVCCGLLLHITHTSAFLGGLSSARIKTHPISHWFSGDFGAERSSAGLHVHQRWFQLYNSAPTIDHLFHIRYRLLLFVAGSMSMRTRISSHFPPKFFFSPWYVQQKLLILKVKWFTPLTFVEVHSNCYCGWKLYAVRCTSIPDTRCKLMFARNPHLQSKDPGAWMKFLFEFSMLYKTFTQGEERNFPGYRCKNLWNLYQMMHLLHASLTYPCFDLVIERGVQLVE